MIRMFAKPCRDSENSARGHTSHLYSSTRRRITMLPFGGHNIAGTHDDGAGVMKPNKHFLCEQEHGMAKRGTKVDKIV
jgi:hypothetical protein